MQAATDSGLTNANAGELDWRTLISHKHSVYKPYRSGTGVGWMVSQKMLEMMKLISDANGRPLWMPGLVPGEPDLFDNDPIVENTHLPDTGTGFAALYGMLANYWIRQVREFSLQRFDERFAEFGQIGFLLHKRADGRLIDATTDAARAPVKKMSIKLT